LLDFLGGGARGARGGGGAGFRSGAGVDLLRRAGCVEPAPSSVIVALSSITNMHVKNLGLGQPLAPGINLMSS